MVLQTAPACIASSTLLSISELSDWSSAAGCHQSSTINFITQDEAAVQPLLLVHAARQTYICKVDLDYIFGWKTDALKSLAEPTFIGN